MRLPVSLPLVAAALLGCAAAPDSPSSGGARSGGALYTASGEATVFAPAGYALAVRRCGGCHNVGPDDGGPDEGPPFRTLARRYTSLALERRVAQVSAHGADRMPPVSLTGPEAEALVAWIDGLASR